MLNEQNHEVGGIGGGDLLCAEQPVVMLVSVEPIQTTVLLTLIFS